MFIKKIFQDKVDEQVHKQFIRFGKGTYEGRAIVNVRVGNEIKISTSFELTNDLLYFLANLASKFKVSGLLLCKENPTELLKKLGIEAVVEEKTRLFQAKIEQELTAEQLKELAEESYFALLDCFAQGIEFKVKKRLPTPRKGEVKMDEKFCQLKLSKDYWQNFHSEFLFDLPPNLKKARIEHSYIIEKLIIPNTTDLEKARIEAKRQGKIIRKAIVDGKELIKEKEFTV